MKRSGMHSRIILASALPGMLCGLLLSFFVLRHLSGEIVEGALEEPDFIERLDLAACEADPTR